MSAGGGLRPEIQGLRAIAVGVVLLFHVWPSAMPGGYVGVDVFFVISGYLIVGSLVREAEREGRISLLNFYRRRVRRLLPAASLVLACVFAATFLLLPPPRWSDTLLQVAASALYVENWYLSWSAVDYLAAENAASPVQHYWSLSIEEQFYIVWPLLMVLATGIGKVIRLSIRHILGALISVIFVGSLAASIWLTAKSPESAYFVSHTRVWELALGGLLAIWLPRLNVNTVLRGILFLVGLAAIIASSFLYDPAKVPFPSYTALLPTLGAALIILVGDFKLGFFRGLNYLPLKYLGDISYSLYLWHWPLIAFFLATGREIRLVEGAVLIAASIAISHVSYHFVEEWFRHAEAPKEYRTLPFGLASILVIAGATGVAFAAMGRDAPAAAAVQVASDADPYPGPAALVTKAVVPAGVPLKPSPMRLLDDKASVYDSGCHQNQTSSEVLMCEFGDPDGQFKIAVVGSSHSVNWLPTMDVLGKKNGWKIYSITKSSCSFVRTDKPSCNEWFDKLIPFLQEHPVDVALVGEFAGKSASQADQQAIADRWKLISDLGVKILAIRPTPHLETAPADCVPDNIDRCIIPREEANTFNSIALAASTVPGVFVIDMNDAICAKDVCSPVVGNMVVFRDKHHLTATYAIALAPYLEQAVATTYPGLLPIRDGLSLADFQPQAEQEAVLQCSAIGGSAAFSRGYELVLQGNQLSLSRGDWRNEVSAFEIWQGKIEHGAVSISGRYREGGAELKTIDMIGTVENGSLVAAGRRGPRTCSIVWTLPGSANPD